MTFSDEDRALARALCKDKNTVAFLERLFAPDEKAAADALALTFEKNVLALSDEDYGHMMKLLYISREMFKGRFAQLRTLGSGSDEERTPRAIAPK